MRQIDEWYGQPEIAALEERVRRLESQVAALSLAVEELEAGTKQDAVPRTLDEQPPSAPVTER